MLKFTRRIINPPRYKYFLKGHAPCNYTLSSRTNYRTLAVPEDMYAAYQVEAFYKYQYDSFEIDWAFRSFEYANDYRMFNLMMVTDKGLFKEDMTRSIYDNEIFMRWTTFVSKLEPRDKHLFITNEPGTRKVIWFYPKSVAVDPEDSKKVLVTDTDDKIHIMDYNEKLMKAFLCKDLDYIDIDETNLIPVYWFRMWYTLF